MTQFFAIHPVDPQARLLRRAAEVVLAGGLIAYPTDTTYALGCRIGDRVAVERVRALRELGPNHHFTLVCLTIAQAAQYARIDDMRFRLMKQAGAGGYAFILTATREVPRRLQHPRRRTIGVRLAGHPVTKGLLEELGEPLLSSTLQLPDDMHALNGGEEIRARLAGRIELVLDAGPCGIEPATIVDLTGQTPVVLREGKGALERIGLVVAT